MTKVNSKIIDGVATLTVGKTRTTTILMVAGNPLSGRISSSMSEFSKDQFTERTQDHLNKYITAADQKASILLTGQFTFLGLLATATREFVRTSGELFYWLSIGTAVAGITAALLAIAVIYPRSPSPEEGYIYWESIIQFESKEKLHKKFEKLSESDLTKEIVMQNYMLAKVANKKYCYLRWSLRITLVMIFLASSAGVIYLV